MEAMRDHVHLIVGASKSAEQLRRFMVRSGRPHGRAAGHLRGVRRRMIVERRGNVTVYVALDHSTLGRHGAALRTLMSDLQRSPGVVQSVGLLDESGLTAQVAEIGCDLYVDSFDEAARVMRMESSRKRCEIAACFGGEERNEAPFITEEREFARFERAAPGKCGGGNERDRSFMPQPWSRQARARRFPRCWTPRRRTRPASERGGHDYN